MGKNQHVVPYNGHWAVRAEGSPNVTTEHLTQGAAEDMARRVAQVERSQVIIHRRDGTIRDSDSYGNDPFPPRDRKH